MPNRILREGICKSDDINSLTPEQEVLFYRLLVTCDDYGRFDARPAIIKAACFPLRDVSTSSIDLQLSSLESAGLLTRYVVAGKPLLAVAKWDQHQRIRAARAKYPPPSDADPPSHDSELRTGDSKPLTGGSSLLSSAPRAGAESESESESESTPYAASGKATRPPATRILLISDGWEGITRQQIDLWVTAYPAVAVSTELAAASAWAHANPANRKSNWHRFLTAWLKRAQDRAPVVAKLNGKSKGGAWWVSEAGVIAKAKELGMNARPGETLSQLQGRVQVALEASTH